MEKRPGVAVWDHRRNSSAVHPVPPDALPDALRSLAAWKVTDPAVYQWVTDGAPNLTADEHVARFGGPYHAQRSRKTRAQA